MRNSKSFHDRSLRVIVDSINKTKKELLHEIDGEDLDKNPNNLTAEDLAKVEKDRRQLLNRVKRFSVFNILTSFQGTVLPGIISAPYSWLIIAFYARLRVLMRYVSVGKDFPAINTSLVSIIGGFMSFFLIFFVSQAFSRLCQQYDIAMRIEGRLTNLAYLAKNNFATADALRLMRFLHAAHIAAYTGLSNVYTDSNLFQILNKKHRLLTTKEKERLDMIGLDHRGGNCYRELLGWCIEIIYNHYRPVPGSDHRPGTTDSISAKELLGEVFNMRQAIGSLYDYDDQPIPFIYVHILFFLTIFYLLLMTYTTAINMPIANYNPLADILGAFIVALNVIYVVGMREIGHVMMSPFDDDLQDLSVPHYLNITIANTRRVMAGSSPPLQADIAPLVSAL